MKKFIFLMTVLMGHSFAGENEFLKLCHEVATLPKEEQITVKSLIKIGSRNFWGENEPCEDIVKKLKTMKRLELPGGTFHYLYVSSVKPIATLDWVTDLELDGQKGVKDLTPLSSMQLNSLNIKYTGVQDLSQLGELPELRSLSVAVAKSYDLIKLSELKNLTELNLDLGNLGTLDLSYFRDSKISSLLVNGSTEISSLEVLTHLESLIVLGAVVDVRELVGLSLKHFNVGAVKNLEHLAYIPSLETIILEKQEISDLSFLRNLTNLKVLNLEGNRISSLEDLSRLTKLEVLNLRNNEIMFDDVFKLLVNLKQLDLSENRFSFFNATKLQKLESLNLSSNNLHEVTFDLHPNLEEIRLSKNQIRSPHLDSMVAENLASLTKLDLSQNKITTLDHLARLSTLQTLQLDDNKISSISELQVLSTLKYLTLRYNLLKKNEQICPMQASVGSCDFLHQEVL